MVNKDEIMIIGAEVAYNGLGTPQPNGAVVLQRRKSQVTVLSIESYGSAVKAFPDAVVLGKDFAISPPPVNAHTHLDLSKMPYSPGSYEEFIPQVVRHRRRLTDPVEAAKIGVERVKAAGTTVIGDIVKSDSVMRFLLNQTGLRGVAYLEVFEPDPTLAKKVFFETEERIKEYQALEKPSCMQVGISLHSPHTVSEPLLKEISGLSVQRNLPLQIHVSETSGEIAFHKDGTGPFPELYGDLLRNWKPSGLTPVGYLAKIGVLKARPTLVHMVHVNEADVREVQRAGCTVVHCPRSNANLNCGRFPWAMFAKHGTTVAIGTDSLGSSQSLSVYEEVHEAMALHGNSISPLALVRSAVKGGHRALGLRPPKVGRGDDQTQFQVWGRRGPNLDLGIGVTDNIGEIDK